MVSDPLAELVELVPLLDPERLHQPSCLTLGDTSFGCYVLDRIVDRSSTIEHPPFPFIFPKPRPLIHLPHGQAPAPTHNILVPKFSHISDGTVHGKN